MLHLYAALAEKERRLISERDIVEVLDCATRAKLIVCEDGRVT